MIGTHYARGLSVDWYASAEKHRLILLTLALILVCAASILLVLVFQVISLAVLLTWIVAIAIAWRPLVGLATAYALALVFEAGGADQLMAFGGFFNGSLQTVGFSGAIASPMELLLLVTLFTWVGQGIARRNIDFRGGRLGRLVLLFCLCLIAGLVRGAVAGGNLNIALWESRFLFYVVICYVVAANTIRTRRHVGILITITLICIGLFSVEGAYRRIFLIDTGRMQVMPEFAYSHEDSIFLGTIVLLVLAQNVFGAPAWQRVLGLLLLPVCVFTMLATERRAAYIAVIVAFLGYTLVFAFVHRKAFFTIALPVLIVGSIYVPIFWNNTTLLGQPARAIRSLSQPDPRDAASNLYRDLEAFDVRATIRANPILGVGFGREFDFVLPLPDLSWWQFWHYEPHHNVLWIWLKTGTLGFIIFWTLMSAALARAARLLHTVTYREGRVFALLAIAGIITTLTFCYVDLGLVSGRVTVFLGTLLGTLAVLDRIDTRSVEAAATSTAAELDRTKGTRFRHALVRNHLHA